MDGATVVSNFLLKCTDGPWMYKQIQNTNFKESFDTYRHYFYEYLTLENPNLIHFNQDTERFLYKGQKYSIHYSTINLLPTSSDTHKYFFIRPNDQEHVYFVLLVFVNDTYCNYIEFDASGGDDASGIRKPNKKVVIDMLNTNRTARKSDIKLPEFYDTAVNKVDYQREENNYCCSLYSIALYKYFNDSDMGIQIYNHPKHAENYLKLISDIKNNHRRVSMKWISEIIVSFISQLHALHTRRSEINYINYFPTETEKSELLERLKILTNIFNPNSLGNIKKLSGGGRINKKRNKKSKKRKLKLKTKSKKIKK